MRGITLAATAALCLLFSSTSESDAKRRFKAAQQPCMSVTHDDRYPVSEGSCYKGSVLHRGVYKTTNKSRRSSSSSSLVSVQCGPKPIRVASTAATQFRGFCTDLYGSYKFRVVGGWRPGKCWTGGKHPCGGAIDIDQTCRSRGPGHCLPGAFPVAASERLADKWGLHPGSRWGHRDVGHFETKSSLAGNGWTPKVAVEVAAAPAPMPPKRWPVVLASADASYLPQKEMWDHDIALPFIDTWEISPFTQPEFKLRFTPKYFAGHELKLAYYIYADTVAVNPAKIAMDYLRDTPEGTPHEEVTRAADLFDLDRAFLHALVRAESSYRPWEVTGSYIGLCQLSKYQFKRYSGGGEITNARANVIACAHKLAVEAAIVQHATNTDITAAKRYMVHQQGLGGATEHYSRPDRNAIDSMHATEEGKIKGKAWATKAICLNTLPVLRSACKSITSGEFIAHWTDKIERFMAAGRNALINTAQAAEPPKAKKKKTKYAKKIYKKRYAKKGKRIRYAAR